VGKKGEGGSYKQAGGTWEWVDSARGGRQKLPREVGRGGERGFSEAIVTTCHTQTHVRNSRNARREKKMDPNIWAAKGNTVEDGRAARCKSSTQTGWDYRVEKKRKAMMSRAGAKMTKKGRRARVVAKTTRGGGRRAGYRRPSGNAGVRQKKGQP